MDREVFPSCDMDGIWWTDDGLTFRMPPVNFSREQRMMHVQYDCHIKNWKSPTSNNNISNINTVTINLIYIQKCSCFSPAIHRKNAIKRSAFISWEYNPHLDWRSLQSIHLINDYISSLIIITSYTLFYKLPSVVTIILENQLKVQHSKTYYNDFFKS